MKNALAFFLTVLGILGIIEGVNVATDHLQAADFPAHARFHAALGGLYLIAMSVAVLIFAWGAIRWNFRTAPALAVIILSLPLCALVGIALVPDGAPPQPHITLAVIGLVISVICTFLAFKLRL